MRANPGGEIGPNEVIGRNEFIENFWEILENQAFFSFLNAASGKPLLLKR